MTSAVWHSLTSSGAAADLSDGVRLRLTGPDAVRYLNGQVTNDVRKILPGTALPACFTNHKGKLEAFVHVSSDAAGTLFISGDAALRDFLPLRLEKYLIADNCVLDEVSETTALIHLIAPVAQTTALLTEGERLAAVPRFGLPGADVWTTPDRLAFWLGHFPALSPEDQSTLEVLHGIPAWDHELTSDLLPPEAGLDATAIDYHKGCYIGQEVISRIRSVGRVNRQLASLIQTEGPPVEPGFEIRPGPHGPSDDPAAPTPPPLGILTRVADHPTTGQRHALAFLHRNTPPGPLHGGPAGGPFAAILSVRKTLDD